MAGAADSEAGTNTPFPDPVLLVASASVFVAINLGLRISPCSNWLLALLRQDAEQLTRKQRRAYVHGAAHRITSHLHNMIAIPLGLMVLADPELQADPMYAKSALGSALVLFSASYFAHDLFIVTMYFSEAGLGFFLHGFFCCGLYCYGVFYHQLQYFAAAFIMWELSTPFVALRWFLYESGMKNTKVYVANGIAMMVAFFVARIAMGGYFSYVFWVATGKELAGQRPGGFEPPFIYFFRLANIVLSGLNCVWFSKMARGALQLLFRKGPKSEAAATSGDGVSNKKAD